MDPFVVSVTHPVDNITRRFVANREDFTWDLRPTTCLYAGNRQGGKIAEVESPNDPVIQGEYKDYKVSDAFATDFAYAQFDQSVCSSVE